MGVAIHGIKATNKSGKYFNRSWWGWRRLWAYSYWTCMDFMSEKQYVYGQYNDGLGLDDIESSMMAERLMLHYVNQDSDTVKTDLKKFNAWFVCEIESCDGKSENYQMSWEDVKEFATFLKNCGGFMVY